MQANPRPKQQARQQPNAAQPGPAGLRQRLGGQATTCLTDRQTEGRKAKIPKIGESNEAWRGLLANKRGLNIISRPYTGTHTNGKGQNQSLNQARGLMMSLRCDCQVTPTSSEEGLE